MAITLETVFGQEYKALSDVQRRALDIDLDCMLSDEGWLADASIIEAAAELRARIGGNQNLAGYTRIIVVTYGLD